MATDDAFAALMTRLRSGEDSAAREVFERFAGRLIGLARRQFGELLARKVDPEDVVQSAYKSFFVRHRDGQFTVESWNALWKLLALITLRKCADRAEYFRAARRDAAREAADAGLAALDREPGPDEAAVLAATVERLFRDVYAHERPVLELSLQGYTVP